MAMGVEDLTFIATAAVRDARNGADFVRAAEQRTGRRIQILPGAEEARLSALGLQKVEDAGAIDAAVDRALDILERLREADRKIESLALMDVYGRVARLLLEMAEEDAEGQQVVKRKISKQDIAKMIGASREMVSRVMKDLGQQGLIEEGPDGILLRERLNDV